MNTTELHDVFYQYVPVGALLTTLRYLFSNSKSKFLKWQFAAVAYLHQALVNLICAIVNL